MPSNDSHWTRCGSASRIVGSLLLAGVLTTACGLVEPGRLVGAGAGDDDRPAPVTDSGPVSATDSGAPQLAADGAGAPPSQPDHGGLLAQDQALPLGPDGGASAADGLSASADAASPPSGLINSAQEVAYDMFGPATGTAASYSGGAMGWDKPWPNHELVIASEGTPYKWLTGGWGSKWNVPGTEKAIYARCKVVPAKGGVGQTNFKLQLRGLRSYERINGVWSLHQSSDSYGLLGDWYDLANFLGDPSISVKLTKVAGSPGVYEIPWPKQGEIFHYFMGMKGLPAGHLRKLFNPSYDASRDTFFATGQMRLVPHTDPSVDLSQVRLLGNCGLDYYKNETSTRKQDYPGKPVPSSGHARSKLITAQWQAFNWYPTPFPKPKQSGEPRTWQQLRQLIEADPPPLEQ